MTHKRTLRVFTIILVWAMLCLSLFQAPAAHAQSQAVVNVETLNVRQGPGLEHPVFSQIGRGEAYSVMETKNDWIQIKLSSGELGWVADWLVTRQVLTQQIQVRSQVDVLNIRSGPSTQFPVIQQMNKDDGYPFLVREGDWIQIELSKDLKGWVAEWLTSTSSDSNQASSPSPTQVKISASILNVRSGPSTDFNRIGQLQNGDIVTVHEINDQWYKIDYNGQTGWVAGWLVQKISGSAGSETNPETVKDGPQVKIINPGTNLRSGPGTNYSVVDRGNEGDLFPILETKGKWYKISLSSGKPAYVAGWIVATKGITPIVDPKLNSYLSEKTIIIDPGHGGKDNGATGSHFDTLEKVLNMKVSFLLKNKLEAAGAKVILTRETDSKISLETRVNLAHQHKADAFISVHHNTHANSRISGGITYYYEGSRDRKLANLVQREIIKQTKLKDLKARKGDFFVLRENAQLAVLCELGFLTNYQDEFRVRTKKFQEQAAEGIFQGILLYFKAEKEDKEKKEENSEE
jgi:N-acetylmuramoyl-L-alanine amidase